LPSAELSIPSPSSTFTLTIENVETQNAKVHATKQAERLKWQAVKNMTATIIALTPTVPPTGTPVPTKTITSSPTISPSPTPTVDKTQRAWHATAIVVQKTQRAESEQAMNEKATQIAQFPTPCDKINSGYSTISPDEKWFAASCGYKRDQMLIVQNQEGTKWTLEFEDFLSEDTRDGIMGLIGAKAWSPDGKYLYFTTGLGYSGGGTLCFPGLGFYGDYGLFRLDLQTGTWVTLVPPTSSFPGYAIEFSPNGKHYVIVKNGVTITDLVTGGVTKIDKVGVQKFSWSPDGQYLAYSVASCGDWQVESSSVYVWDASSSQTHLLVTVDEILLRPEFWKDNSILRIKGEEFIDNDSFYTIYEYDLSTEEVVFSGTATPYP